MLAELYVLNGRDAGKVLDAGSGPSLFLGRAATNHLRIRDPQASRVHCRIDVTTRGLTLLDTNSGNGTFVNGNRVVPQDPLPLQDGDEIRIGVTRMRILIESEEERRTWASDSPSSVEGDSPSSVERLEASQGSEVSEASAVAMHAAQADPNTPSQGELPPSSPDEDQQRKRKSALREVIPGYRLQARLGGHGRQGIAVYRAIQHSLGRPVALKVFLPRGPTRKEDVERFLRQARTISSLPHANVVTIHDVIARRKMRAIVMEYLAGGSLADRLEDGRALSTREIHTIGESICSALAYLHTHGVVHRGVKPSNILIAREHGTYKLSNFGLATGPRGERRGDTSYLRNPLEGFAYLAPEQVREDPQVTPATDVYAMGATLYACAAGAPPFEGDSLPELGTAILRDPPPPLDATVPESLQTIVERCIRKDPAERYPDGASLLHELRASQAWDGA